MSEYRYKLSLEITDHGDRTFTATSESDCQSEFADSLAFDIGRMLGILNCPPDEASLVLVSNPMNASGIFVALARLKSAWDANHDFDSAFAVTVDVSRLLSEAEPDDVAVSLKIIKKMGWNAINIPRGSQEEKP